MGYLEVLPGIRQIVQLSTVECIPYNCGTRSTKKPAGIRSGGKRGQQAARRPRGSLLTALGAQDAPNGLYRILGPGRA